MVTDAHRSMEYVGAKLRSIEEVDIDTFVDAWAAAQISGLLAVFLEILGETGGYPAELEERFSMMPVAAMKSVRERLYRGLLATYMEAAQHSRGWSPGGLGLLHVQLAAGGGSVRTGFIGYSGLERANKAFERTGVDPLQMGERGVSVLLTIERPRTGLVDTLFGHRYENYWLHPLGVTVSKGGSLLGGSLKIHKYAQLTDTPANWEAPQALYKTGSVQTVEITGHQSDDLVWPRYHWKVPIAAGFGEAGIVGWQHTTV
jgi:hypothetical protein